MTKPDISGAATLMHGYAARDGLGITLIRNHIVDMIPSKMNIKPGGKPWDSIQFLIFPGTIFSFLKSNLPFIFVVLKMKPD